MINRGGKVDKMWGKSFFSLLSRYGRLYYNFFYHDHSQWEYRTPY
jgi:hypothetical protein